MSDDEPDRTVPRTPPAPEHTAGPPAPTNTGREGTQVQHDAPTHLFTPDALPVVPGYVVSREIARGGMGVVYAAHDPTFDREVAVKVMHPGQDAARFVIESKVTAQLPHPGIPPVYALGALADGRPFLAMKLIHGRTLADELKASDLPPLLGAFEQICQTVGFAHSRDIIHRDLKPANVMVGAFGEVQVMDWGLAKHVGSEDTAGVADAYSGAGTVQETVAGQVKGTPSYMAPEQARGQSVGPAADVFALGGILAVTLTGKPPFLGETVIDTVLKAAQAELGECFAQLDACGADAELVSVAKRCLAAKAEDRFANGQEVAEAVAAYRAGVDARLQQAERDRAVSAAESREQRKRRRVQLALAGLVVLVAVGAGVATNLVRTKQAEDRQAADKQRADDQLAAEKKLSDERLAGEQKRQADLRAADAAALAKQRQARADGLVQALASADPAGVPRLIDDLKEYRDRTAPKLRQLASQPVTTKPGLHARLALLADEPAHAAVLAVYLPTCLPDELLPVVQLLKPHAGAVAPGLWAVLTNAKADAGKRVRAACALAGLTPDDARWKTVAPAVADAVVKENALRAVVWAQALDPVRGELLAPLLKRYASARERIRGGKLDESALVAEASGFDLTASLLARYAVDRPAELAELAVLVDARHYPLFAEAIRKNKVAVVPILKAELAKKPPEGLPNDTLDAALEAHGKRRGHAAAVLLTLGEREAVWPVFAFPKDGDPTARSYLQERLAAIGADPAGLVRRFGAEADVSARRALLVALGDFPVALVPVAEREALVAKLLVLYRDDPDSGLHSAIDWLLRQKWGKAKELAAIDVELAREARGRVTARALAGAVPPGPLGAVVGPQLPAARVAVGKDWFVNGEGQTYAVVRGPVEFTLGSPESEPGRIAVNEPAHQKRIGRSFAIGTKEVTVAEFLRFRPEHSWVEQYSPDQDSPAVEMTWYAAAEYCNWLSAREGIPREQWCYESNKDGAYDEGMRMKVGHLGLTGYRLPTEVESEYGCRSGSVTARYFGRGEGLLPRYGWFDKNAEDRAWPVGQLRPNERGLFDALGNALEWVEDPGLLYVTGQKEDKENSKYMSIDERISRLLRGGSFVSRPDIVRCALRNNGRPGNRLSTNGFRPVRTLLN